MSKAHNTLQWLRSEPHGARSDEEKLERLAWAIEEDSIRTLDCFAVGEDLRTNPECCQLFMSEKQAEEYRRTWNPEGEWKIWPIAIYVEVPNDLAPGLNLAEDVTGAKTPEPQSLAAFDAIKRSYETK